MTSSDDSEQRAGIPKPDMETGAVVTPEQMRASIYANRYDSELIHMALTHGEIKGLQAEDVFVILGYRTLRSLEDLHVLHQACKERIVQLSERIVQLEERISHFDKQSPA